MKLEQIKRQWLLFCSYFKMNLNELEVYDKDFLFGIISKLLTFFSGCLMLFYIFDYMDSINGWTLEQILFLFSLNQIGFSLWACFFINTITLPYYIQTGELDRFLLRPISPIFQIMMDGFDDDSWGDLLSGAILFVYAWLSLDISTWFVLLVPVIWLSACLIYASISLILSTVSFFTIAHADVANFVNEIQEFAQYPINIYPKVIQIIFTFIFFFFFIAFVPSMIIFQEITIWAVFLLPCLSIVFLKLASMVWYWGLKHYGGTGT